MVGGGRKAGLQCYGDAEQWWAAVNMGARLISHRDLELGTGRQWWNAEGASEGRAREADGASM